MPSSEPKRQKIQAIKGTRDILPPESALWNRVEQTARDVFATYGFGEIRLPIFEASELFRRSVGAESDIISKEMYSVENPNLARLEIFRRAVLDARIAKSYPYPRGLWNAVRDFVGASTSFLFELKRANESGQIAQTGTISDQIVQIQDLVTQAEQDFSSRGDVDDSEYAKWSQRMDAIQRILLEMKFQEDIRLRPEATASVCRAYIEHGMHTWRGDVKLYYIGPMFRRERPQKGRYRQFYQIGAEVLGQSDTPAIDAEVIEMLMAYFERVGLRGCMLYVNSIGCSDCRPKYVETLRAALLKVKDQLGPDSQRRIETNPLRVLDSKLESEQAIIEKLPRITDHLCPACREHFAQLEAQLKLRGVAYEQNWRLVRGLDYYMRTTFEITALGLGSQNAVCGGGRYDGLVELLGGLPTKGIGFAIGTDRLILSLQGAGPPQVGAGAPQARDIYIVWMGATAQPAAIKLARRLRDAGLNVEIPPEETKIKKALGLADKLGARFAVIIGENEVASGRFTVKRLADATQRQLGESELLEFVRS